jgi:hypothetical protein
MANRTHRQLEGASVTRVALVYGRFVGNATSTGTLPATDNDDIVSITRTGVGTHTMVWRHKYPGTVMFPDIKCLGTTAGLSGRFTALDMTAGTATILTEVGAVATDAATTDTVFIRLDVRNSNQNT